MLNYGKHSCVMLVRAAVKVLHTCHFYRHSMDDMWKPLVESFEEHQILIFTMRSILIFSALEASNDLICAFTRPLYNREPVLSRF